MGVLVDRFGARVPLIGGLTLMAASFGLMGTTDSYALLLVLAFLGGLGNSVFHPADYTVLGATIAPRRLGRAYGIHTFAGQMGWVAAPPAVIFLATVWNWRAALGVLALLGLATAFVLLVYRDRLAGAGSAASPEPTGGPAAVSARSGLALLVAPAVMLMFLFFVATAGVQVGIMSFTPTGLGELYGTPLVTANAALTGFLVGGAGGVLLGGVIADRVGRLDLIAACGFTASGAALCLVALVALPVVPLVAIFAFAGVMLGIIAPSRDLLVRSIAPAGTSGRVFGFVSTGLDVGGGLSPLLFGWILDQGAPQAMFLVAALLMLVSLAAGVGASRIGRPAAGAAAAE